MEVVKVLEKAKSLGIYIELKDDNLVLKSTKKSIDPDFLKILKKEKINIINHLKIYRKRDRSAIISSEEIIKVYDRDQYEHIPLSFSQERLWFLDQLQGSLEYHQPFAMRLSGNLDIQALSRSLRQVVDRHEVLRTVIYEEEGIGYQKVLDSGNWELSEKDLRKDNSLLSEDLKTFLSAPFDLSADYMFRSCLYQVENNEYVLAGVFHHISSDGWSQGILIRDFMALYHAEVSGKKVSLPPLSLQYIDYALWQRTYLEGKVMDKQLAYWDKKLEDVNVLRLPTDFARPKVQSVAGANISFELSSQLSSDINALSKNEGTTVFMTLLAAFKVLLSRYSGQEDICVGTPVANRTQKELEGMIGFFINTLTLRSKIQENISFNSLLQDVKQTTLDAYDHQQVPFEKVVERVVKTRDLSVSPLFQVLFVLQNTPEASDAEIGNVEGLKLSHYNDRGSVTSKFDLTINVHESDKGFALNLNYCTDLFKKETIEQMIIHYQELLKAVVASPSSLLSDLSMMQEEERNQLLDVFGKTVVSYPADKTVIDLFEEQAAKSPEAPAVVYGEGTLSYGALNERSNQLARYLVSKGVKPDDLVGICIDRSTEMLVGILGILKAGGAYVPIDPDYPQDRQDYMLADSKVNLLISDSKNVSGFSEREGLEVIALDDNWNQKFGRRSVKNLKRVSSPSNLAYVIYTSGSTGKPKGVLISHQALMDHCYGVIDKTNMKSCSSFGLSSSIAMDAGNTVIYGSLILGGALHVLSQDDVISSDKIADLDFLKIVPSYWKTLQSKNEVIVPKKSLMLGGEAFTDDVFDLLASNQVSCEVYNHYGPTEATVGKLIHQVSLTEEAFQSVPLGVPFGNTRAYVLDANSNLCPIGVVGELCLGGDGLAVGYLNRESLTAEKFVADPFKEGERIYKTGDLVRWLPDGKLTFIGRKDNQIKIRGYRIELGEIENVLSSVSGVTHSCVLAKADAYGYNRLIGYVAMEKSYATDLDKDAIQNELLQSLPDYMVPNLWVKLDEIPLTASGKLDRNALPELDLSGLLTKEYVAPETETEVQLAEIWQDLLGIEKVGVKDDFFEMGGHSLLATRLVSIIRRELQVELAIRDVFTNTTINNLATHIDAQNKGSLLPEVVAQDRPEKIPLSFSQERLWFLDQLQGSVEYNMPFRLLDKASTFKAPVRLKAKGI
ncbi:MAG: amino acid adenylation domain-containing protein, partial [Bacteroidota bacterium]